MKEKKNVLKNLLSTLIFKSQDKILKVEISVNTTIFSREFADKVECEGRRIPSVTVSFV